MNTIKSSAKFPTFPFISAWRENVVTLVQNRGIRDGVASSGGGMVKETATPRATGPLAAPRHHTPPETQAAPTYSPGPP